MSRSSSAKMLAWMGVGLLACGERKVENGGAGGTEEAETTTDLSDTDTDPGDESGTETEGCGFVGACEEQPDELCDPVEQDCPDGEKCVWYVHENSELRREAAKCIPVVGDLQPFEPCTLPSGTGPEITDDCAAESYCLEVYGTADHGFCAPFVDGHESYSCDAYPGTVAAVENGSVFPSACLHYECQPLLPGSCPDGMQCTFYPAFLYGTTMCWYVAAPSDLPLGTACDYGECGAGKLCAPAEWVPGCEGERCCAQWCDLDAPACDDLDASCLFFPHSAFPYAGDEADFESLGACVLPGSFD